MSELSQDKRAEILLKRIDHTLGFTMNITKLMYLATGAGLAFFYYVVRGDSGVGTKSLAVETVAITLALMNLIHANFIHNQHAWFEADSMELEAIAGNAPNARKERYSSLRTACWWFPLKRSHTTFCYFHILTAVAILVLGTIIAWT